MSSEQDRVIEALLTVAARYGDEQRASLGAFEVRAHENGEAERIAAAHGFGPDRIIAMRSLARSRGLELSVVLRAALAGDLRDVVRLPPVPVAS